MNIKYHVYIVGGGIDNGIPCGKGIPGINGGIPNMGGPGGRPDMVEIFLTLCIIKQFKCINV